MATKRSNYTPAQRKEWLALCAELPLIENRLRGCGMLATATQLNKAVKRIGYEAAELRTKAGVA